MVLIHKNRSGVDGGDSNLIFHARCDNVRVLHSILKAVAFRETATVSISRSGIRITVEELKCLQANAFLQQELFHEFVIREETINFRLNVNVLCECLNLFGTGASSIGAVNQTVKFCYSGYGSPLKVLLEEGGIVTDCSIKTMEPDALLDFDFSPSSIVSKIIMKPDALRETFQELDNSCELLELKVHPTEGFRISASGVHGSVETEFPKDSEIIDSFTCSKIQSFKYRINLLKPTAKALQLADKISNRIDDRGFLSMQFMIDFGGTVMFIEFDCAPEYDAETDSSCSQ